VFTAVTRPGESIRPASGILERGKSDMPLIQQGQRFVFLNNEGKIGYNVGYVDDTDAVITRFNPNGSINTGGGPFQKANEFVSILLHPNGNIFHYESQSADGSYTHFIYDDGPPTTPFASMAATTSAI
jgi:hypothetical protein